MPDNIVTPELLKALSVRYPVVGAIVLASDYSSFTLCQYDHQGNQLRITAQAGGLMRYEEIPLVKREVEK